MYNMYVKHVQRQLQPWQYTYKNQRALLALALALLQLFC
jgi:hypothetical protein